MKVTRIFIVCMLAVVTMNAQEHKNVRKGIVREVKYSISLDKKNKFDYTPLAGVKIKLDANIGELSKKDGTFKLFPKEMQFRLFEISKNDYDLVSPNDYTRVYNCSSELLEVIMVKKETREKFVSNKKLDAEIPIEEDKLRNKKELNEKRKKGLIGDVEYFKQLNKLEEEYKKRLEQMIDFIDKYSYDYFLGIDENRENLYNMLIEGNLKEFDSLMRLNGDFEKRELEIKTLSIIEEDARLEKEKKIEKLANDYYMMSQRYEQVFNHDSVLYYLQKRVNLDTNNIVWMYDIMEYLQYYVGDYDETIKYCLKIWNHCETVFEEEHPYMANLSTRLSLVCYNKGFYEEALMFSHAAMEIQERIPKFECSELMLTYNAIGLINYAIGKFDESFKYYKKAIDVCEQKLDSIMYGSIYSNIGLIFNAKGMYSDALNYFYKAKHFLETNDVVDDRSIGIIYNNIGMAQMGLANYEEAIVNYEKALKILEKVLSSEHPELATIYSNIGIINYKKGNNEEALHYTLEAKKLQEYVLDSNNVALAITYNNLGLIYYSNYIYDAALKYFDKAISIREFWDSNSLELGTLYNNIGLVYHSIEKYDEAFRYFNKAKILQENYLDSNNIILAITYNNIAMIYEENKNYEKALIYFIKARNIQEQFGNSIDLATICANIGNVYEIIGIYDESILNLNRALNILEKKLDKDDYSYIQIIKEKIEEVKHKMKEK